MTRRGGEGPSRAAPSRGAARPGRGGRRPRHSSRSGRPSPLRLDGLPSPRDLSVSIVLGGGWHRLFQAKRRDRSGGAPAFFRRVIPHGAPADRALVIFPSRGLGARPLCPGAGLVSSACLALFARPGSRWLVPDDRVRVLLCWLF